MAYTETDHGWPHWTTPEWYLERVRRVGPIGLDPCSNPKATTGAYVEFYGPGYAKDGLAESWIGYAEHGLVFVNPPYGRELPKWTAKSAAEAARGCEIVALVPARTDTRWAHDHVFSSAAAILFHKKRIKFGNPPPNAKGSDAPKFPSMTAYWGRRPANFAAAFEDLGLLIYPGMRLLDFSGLVTG